MLTIQIVTLAVFVIVYLVMGMGHLPWLKTDRTGTALVGAFLLIAVGAVPVAALPQIIEMPTLLMLLALMLLAAHFAESGSFLTLAHWLSHRAHRQSWLLAGVIVSSGVLSMMLVNDVVVFAFTPVLCTALIRQNLDPRPYLLGLAGSANAGSAASLIGNPQNILLAEIGELAFGDYFLLTIVPVIFTLILVYSVIWVIWRQHFRQNITIQPWQKQQQTHRWLLSKSLIATFALIALLVLFPNYRHQIAVGIVLILLLGRGVQTPKLLRDVDFSLLLMISALFVITTSFSELPAIVSTVTALQENGWLPNRLGVLLPFSLIASNTIGNVPAVMLLVSVTQELDTVTLQGLALFSTLAGNLLLTGSLANIIVAERAHAQGIKLSFLDFMKVGVPITILSIIPAAIWFAWQTKMQW